MTLLAEDLTLLLLDDDSGRFTHHSYLVAGLGGALLAELALGGWVQIGEPSGLFRRSTVEPTGAPPPEHPVLADALEEVTAKDRTASELVTRLGRAAREPLLETLAERGILRREEGRVLGLFSSTTWPTDDARHEREMRAALTAAIAEGRGDARAVALLSVLSAMDIAHKVLPVEGLGGREVRRRVKEMAEGDWAAKAVRDAVAAVDAAVMSAVVATTVTGSGGSS
ncbi:GOLPH3/VPS74 family protein [Georgenia sp. Z1491]|uniref:GOLPH3/VPS74 family protein n=1 Tax=Georgenia sp. Z1491 TaxID=3416707 RepID=UPI003CF62B4E